MIVGTPGNSLALRPVFNFYTEFMVRGDCIENIPPFINIDKLNSSKKIYSIYQSGYYLNNVFVNDYFTAGISPLYGRPNVTLNLNLFWRNLLITDTSGNPKTVDFNYFNNDTSYFFKIASGILPLRLIDPRDGLEERDNYTQTEKQNLPILYNVLAQLSKNDTTFSSDELKTYPS